MIFSTPNEVDSDEETFETKFEGDLLEDDDEYAEDEKDAAELRWGEILKELGGAPSSLFNTDDKLTESRQNEQEFENTRKEFTQEFIEDDDDQDEEIVFIGLTRELPPPNNGAPFAPVKMGRAATVRM